MLPKTSAYEKSYNDQTELMYFLIEDDKSQFWYEKEFDSKPV